MHKGWWYDGTQIVSHKSPYTDSTFTAAFRLTRVEQISDGDNHEQVCIQSG